MTPDLLEIRDVSKTFGGTIAVDNVTLTLSKGEILGLIGPNGSGKTTLINLISGVYPVSKGTIVFKGEDISRKSPDRITRRGVARTFQVVKPLGGFNLRQNVLVGTLFGSADRSQGTMAEKVARADEALQMVGLYEKRFSEISELAGAELKRLEIARALSMKPTLLLLDEVMAGLNSAEIDEMTKLIQEVNSDGVTIIFIEHIMRAVMSISQRVMVLHHGSCLAVDQPEVIAQDPNVIGAYLGARFASTYTGRVG